MTEPRIISISCRGAADLALKPSTTAATYVVLKCGDNKVQSTIDKTGGANPIWNQTLELHLPAEKPETPLTTLQATVYAAKRLLPDTVLGSGTVPIANLLASGSEDLRIPLSKRGKPAGVVYLGARMTSLQEKRAVVKSAAGRVLGEEAVKGEPGELAAAGMSHAQVRSSTGVSPVSETNVGVISGLTDPSKPTYGILA
jgi:Ca2+-dependent lipid-binding protein